MGVRALLATWLFRLAYRLDHKAVGECAVLIAPYYRAAIAKRRRNHAAGVFAGDLRAAYERLETGRPR